jgi:hypothetical protein
MEIEILEEENEVLGQQNEDEDDEEEYAEYIASLQKAAAAIAKKRITDSTRGMYERKLKAFEKFLSKHYPEKVDAEKNIILPVEERTILAFLTSVAYHDPTTKLKPKASSTIGAYYSAVKFLYTEKNVAWNGTSEVYNFLSGFKSTVATAKENGIISSVEGKQPLSMRAFCTLTKFALKSNGRDSLFAHLYMVLCWNLMGRTTTTASLNLCNVSWNGDGLVITIPRHKGDQAGQQTKPKHLFANPYCPEICPVLALAIYIFSCGVNTNVNNNQFNLFDGGSPENAFNKWLHDKALGNITEEELGIPKKETGTHSLRKGAATYVSSFDVVSETNINIRAGWTIGKVQGKYIFGTPGADQLIGRIICGLNIHNCHEFLSLPPHFDDTSIQQADLYQEVIGVFSEYPLCFRKTFEFLIASLSYHQDWISANCHANHPIFSSRIWTNGLLQQVKPFVIMSKRKCGCSLIATGIPSLWSAIGIFDILDLKLKESIELTREATFKLDNLAASMPLKVCERLNENFTFHGQVPVSVAHLHAVLQEHTDRIIQQVQQSLHTTTANDSPGELNETESEDAWPTWTWGGRMHFIPETFSFPTGNSLALWSCWFYGMNKPIRIRPHRMFQNFEGRNNCERGKLKKARIFINILINSSSTLTMAQIIPLNFQQSHDVFLQLFSNVCKEIIAARNERNEGSGANGNSKAQRISRFSQLSWTTIFNELIKYRIFHEKITN